MKAIVATGYGASDVLRYQDVETPSPREREILVRVHATTVNIGDYRMRSLDVPPLLLLPTKLSLGFSRPRQPIFGMELAGEVEALGKDATRFKVGDRVFASTLNANFGAHAEYKCLPEDGAVALMPGNLSYEEAATLSIGANAALYFLNAANIRPGQKVLINGASGTVGTFALQLARSFGAEVTGVCNTRSIELVRSLGAAHVIDYTREDFTQTGETYDVIFDAAGKTTFAQCRQALNAKGYYLHTILPGAPILGPWARLTTGMHIVGGTAPASRAAHESLRVLAGQGHLNPVIDRCYPLDQIVEAYRYVESGRKTGSVVIQAA